MVGMMLELLVLCSLVFGLSSANNLTIAPQPLNATENSRVSFYCYKADAFAYLWYINGTTLSQLPDSYSGLFTGNEFPTPGNERFYFRFTARSIFNKSLIHCKAVLSGSSISSNPVLLLVQGQLGEVKNLTSTVFPDWTIFIDWVAPFSLDLTPTSTETGIITYCVDVYNSSNNVSLVAVCGLVDTNYTYSHEEDPSPCDQVHIQVTPVNSVGNGLKSHMTETFYKELENFMVLDAHLLVDAYNELVVEISNISQLDSACYCSICITPVIAYPVETCYADSCDGSEILFHLSTIRRRQLFTFRVTLQNNRSSATSNYGMLSTYDLQTIEIDPTMASGTLKFLLLYLGTASTKGCFLILSQGQYTGYLAVERLDDDEAMNPVQLEGLPQGEYVVNGYDVGNGGFSSYLKAAVSLNVTLQQGAAFWSQDVTSSSISVNASASGDALCVVCVISAGSTSLGCVVLLHPDNDTSNVTVREVGTQAVQPYCISVQGDFSVAVFEWKSDGFVGAKPSSVSKVFVYHHLKESTSTSTALKIILVSSILSTLAVIGCTIFIICAVVFKYLKGKQIETKEVEMSMNKAYDIPSHLVTPCDPDPVYECVYNS